MILSILSKSQLTNLLGCPLIEAALRPCLSGKSILILFILFFLFSSRLLSLLLLHKQQVELERENVRKR